MENDIIEVMKKFYGGNPPKTVEEYMANYPKGYSRTSLKSKYGLTVSKILEKITDGYIKSNCPIKTLENLKKLLRERGYSLLTEDENFIGGKHPVDIECNTCGYRWRTTYQSLAIISGGCHRCSGMEPITWERLYEKLQIAGKYLPIKVYSGVITQTELRLKDLEIECTSCSSRFTRNALYVFNSAHPEMCHKCYPTSVHAVEFEGLTFSSKFETECYKLIRNTTNDFQVHFKYADLFNTNRRYTGDFLFPNLKIILEVTSYSINSEYHKFIVHKDTLEVKKTLAEQAGYKFFVARTLPEVEEFCKNSLSKDIV